jgi:hypothetical protein
MQLLSDLATPSPLTSQISGNAPPAYPVCTAFLLQSGVTMRAARDPALELVVAKGGPAPLARRRQPPRLAPRREPAICAESRLGAKVLIMLREEVG